MKDDSIDSNFIIKRLTSRHHYIKLFTVPHSGIGDTEREDCNTTDAGQCSEKNQVDQQHSYFSSWNANLDKLKFKSVKYNTNITLI